MDSLVLAERTEALLNEEQPALIKLADVREGAWPIANHIALEINANNVISFLQNAYELLTELQLLDAAPGVDMWQEYIKHGGDAKSLLKDEVAEELWSAFANGLGAREEVLLLLFSILRRKLLRELAALVNESDYPANARNCPICGQKPTFAALVTDGKRQLYCSDCRAKWDYVRTGCPSCGTTHHEQLIELHPEGAKDSVFVELCLNCGSHVKTKILGVDATINPALEDAATLYLNYLVEECDAGRHVGIK